MSNKSITFCDQCGTAKKETNHWFVIQLGRIFQVVTFEARHLIAGSNFKDVCGQACLVKILQQWMSVPEEMTKETAHEQER